jgi:cytochrome bd-type quinol oxidase subunit 2
MKNTFVSSPLEEDSQNQQGVFMHLNFTQVLTIITGIVFIILLTIIYIRNQQGDQRAINVTNQMLLPLLSAIVITLNIIFVNHGTNMSCMGALNSLRYIGFFGTLLLIVVGAFRFFSSPSREQQLITQPLLFAIILTIIVFLIEDVAGCI